MPGYYLCLYNSRFLLTLKITISRTSFFFFLITSFSKEKSYRRILIPSCPRLSVSCAQAPAAGPVRRLGSLTGGRGRHRGPPGELVQSGGQSVQQGGRLGNLHHLQRQWMWHLTGRAWCIKKEKGGIRLKDNLIEQVIVPAWVQTHIQTAIWRVPKRVGIGDLWRTARPYPLELHLFLHFTHVWITELNGRIIFDGLKKKNKLRDEK